MSSYDPFARGPVPVGVRTLQVEDASRARMLPVEIWYPADDAHVGQDLDERTQDRFQLLPGTPEMTQEAVRNATPRSGAHPLVVFSHGFGGTRVQTTHFCTHLASHGYAVVAPDHVGNTSLDMMQQFMDSQASGQAPVVDELLAGFMADRPLDASLLIDRALAGELGLAVDPERIGMTGHSFGGWTTLATAERDPRIRAALPLAPAGGQSALSPEQDPLRDALRMDWERDVPVLYLVADLDTLLPLTGMHELYGRTPGQPRMVVLRNADHMHFCDRVEETHDLFRQMGTMLFSSLQTPEGVDLSAVMARLKSSDELCPGKHAYDFLRGLGLAHLDAHLKLHAPAAELLAGDIEQLMAARGVVVQVA